MSARLSSVVIYRGPSMLDGSPIVVIATGLDSDSANEKTGNVVQTWILREDVDPVEASRRALDASICGQCPHRRSLGGACYVTLHQAPLSVWRAFKRGSYRQVPYTQLARTFAGLTVRLGSYGDPAAVPVNVWGQVTRHASSWLGYTHQWRNHSPATLGRFCMASVDTASEHSEARAAGWRTFRVRSEGEALRPGEFVCPASAEGGKRTTCADCGACNGSTRPTRATPAIMAHGSLARRFTVIQPSINA